MPSIQIYLKKEQYAKLMRMAKAQEKTVSPIVQDALECYFMAKD